MMLPVVNLALSTAVVFDFASGTREKLLLVRYGGLTRVTDIKLLTSELEGDFAEEVGVGDAHVRDSSKLPVSTLFDIYC